jgi:hypothetical protein
MKRQIIFFLTLTIALSSFGQVTVTVTPTNPTICMGDSVLLTASGAIIYSWSPSTGLSSTNGASVYASPTSTTTYVVTGTDGGNTGSASVTVTVNPLPTAYAGADQTICLGQSANLTAFGGGTYLWSNLAMSQSTNVTPTTTTTYTVTVTSNDCSASANVTVFVDSCSGISDNVNETDIQISQNLLDNIITIQITDIVIHNDAIIAMYDIKGQLMIKQSINHKTTDINISGLVSGNYILRINYANKTFSKKIIKE